MMEDIEEDKEEKEEHVEEHVGEHGKLKRHLHFWDGVGVLISIIIGSGIFSSPGVALERSGSPGAALLAWVFSGLLVAIASFCYAELGAMIPSAGGDFDYLKHAYGKSAAFSFAWFLFWISKPGSQAIIATVFGNYIVSVFIGLSHTDNSNLVSSKLAAISLIVAMTAINCIGVKQASFLSNIFTVWKLLLIVVLLIVGVLYVSHPDHQDMADTNLSMHSSFDGTKLGGIGTAMIACLWAYDGWSNLNSLAEELIDFEKRLPLTILGSVSVVILCYIIANASYFAVLSQDTVINSDAIGIEYGKTIGGSILGGFFALGVAFSAAGSANGSIMTGGRSFYAVGRAGMAPMKFGELNRAGAPWFALCAQGFWAVCLICIPGSNFSTLLDYFGPASWFYYAITGSTVIYLRYTQPDKPRPFKVPFYPLPPVLLVIISGCLIVNSFYNSPMFTGIAFSFILLSIPVWYLFKEEAEKEHDDRITLLDSI